MKANCVDVLAIAPSVFSNHSLWTVLNEQLHRPSQFCFAVVYSKNFKCDFLENLNFKLKLLATKSIKSGNEYWAGWLGEVVKIHFRYGINKFGAERKRDLDVEKTRLAQRRAGYNEMKNLNIHTKTKKLQHSKQNLEKAGAKVVRRQDKTRERLLEEAEEQSTFLFM